MKTISFDKSDVETSLSARFYKVANQLPNHPAIVTSEDTLTYGQLNLISNKIANDLLENYKAQTVTRKKAEKLSADELSGRIVIGTLHQSDQRPELCESVAALRTSLKG